MFSAVRPIVPELPPWYAFLREIISRLPLYSRAISIASSFASEPEFTKYTTCIIITFKAKELINPGSLNQDPRTEFACHAKK